MSLLIQAAEYLGNFALGTTVYFKFSVTDATGVLTTLGGTPVVKVYKDNNTTEATAGVTLTVDFDSRTGLCQVAIDTSSDGTFYAAGHDFEAVLTAGTVGLVSVAGTPVGHFSLLNRVDTLADGVAHGGTLGSSTATLALQRVNLSSASGPPLSITAAGNNDNAITATCGAGFGAGMFLAGGADGGAGLYCSGGANSGPGAIFTADHGGGFICQAGGFNQTHAGLLCVGASKGPGARLTGNTDAPGMLCEATDGNADGARCVGNGTGNGFFAQGGSSDAGNGAYFVAGGSSATGNGGNIGLLAEGAGDSPGASFKAASSGDGDGLHCEAAAGGHDIALAGSGNILGSLTGTIDGLTAAGLATLFSVDSTKVFADAVTGSPVKEIANHGSLVAAGLDAVLVESGITAGAGLTNDAGSQLTAINLRQALALITSVLDGVLAGAAGTSITTKPAGKPAGNTRVAATVDSDGNRSALTLKVPT